MILIGGVIMTNTATLTYSGKMMNKTGSRMSLKERIRSYWEKNSLEIMAAMGTLNGSPAAFTEYVELKHA